MYGCAGAVKPVQQEAAEREKADLQNADEPELQTARNFQIAALEFYKDEIKKQLPVSDLNTKNALVLRFDLIDSTARTFIVRATHLNPDGTPSILQPIEYMRNLVEDQVQFQRTNSIGKPLYSSYSFHFPNEQFGFVISGAYELHVVDFETGETVKKLAFFLTESAFDGRIDFEQFPGNRSSRDIRVQPFFTAPRPQRMNFPCQDLSVVFLQDRNWDSRRQDAECDQSSGDKLRFYVTRPKAFQGNFEYRFLDVSTFRIQNARILKIDDVSDPPQLVLAADNPEFSGPTPPDYFPLEGTHRVGADARYTVTEFRLQTGNFLREEEQIYLVGAFNRWKPSADSRMKYDNMRGEFVNRVLLKEGRYQYGYVRKDADTGGFQFVSSAFTGRNHEYAALVFLKDVKRPFYRLASVTETRF